MMKRRDFFKTISAGAAGMAGLGTLPAFSSLITPAKTNSTSNYAWISNHEGNDDEHRKRLENLKKAGVDGILPSSNYKKWISLAEDFDLDVHAWFVTLQRGSDDYLIENHPDWFMVNRKGDSSVDKPAYVDYYKWLCPTRPAAQEYILDKVNEILQIDEIKSVHLDYIRFPDVILPIQLQPTYDIVQDKEYPEYDYCYCSACRQAFQDQHGADPMDLNDPAEHETWNHFRYNRITHLVNRIATVVHDQGKLLSAAVFPTPDIARSLVRQNWPSWNLDLVFPMMYHNFYHKPTRWIGEAVQQCLRELPATTKLFSGVYLPDLDPVELVQAYEHATGTGASGITLFPDHELSEEHRDYLSRVIGRSS
ncbi:MAG: family 10 glycosylhydrolase [Balneolaceae bacterium]